MGLIVRIAGLSLGLACLLLVVPVAHAAVRLPEVIGDNMVLQRDRPVPIWGQARPGERVEVSVRYQGKRQRQVAVANEAGHWKVRLEPMRAGGPLRLTIRASNTIVLRNVLVGEVWLCAGQSNMEMPVRAARDAQREIAAANYPRLRLFSARKKIPGSPARRYAGRWTPCSPATVREFSAAAYYFGRKLQQTLNVPLGLVESSVSTSPIEAWLSEPLVRADPDYGQFVASWKTALARYPAQREKYQQALRQSKGRGGASRLVAPEHPRNEPGGLFRDMIAPLAPYGISGIAWYQGETNINRPQQYRRLLAALIGDWRRHWGQGDLPFIIVQLPNMYSRSDLSQPYTNFANLGLTPRRRVLAILGQIGIGTGVLCLFLALWAGRNRRARYAPSLLSMKTRSNYSSNYKWGVGGVLLILCGTAAYASTRMFHRSLEPVSIAWLRDAQHQVAKTVPNAAMVVTIDIGEDKRTHPLNKQEVGRRLALAALSRVYGKPVEYSGPLYASMAIEGDTIRLRFSHAAGGLKIKGANEPQGFVVAGVDRIFYWARASIESNEVIVSSPDVPAPVAVRYAWANNPPANLVNRVGLPAAPFRTDSWPAPEER